MTTRSASLSAAASLALTDGDFRAPSASRRAWLRASIALFLRLLKNHRMAGIAKKEAAYACSHYLKLKDPRFWVLCTKGSVLGCDIERAVFCSEGGTIPVERGTGCS